MSEPAFHRVEELFHEAVALPADQRRAYLEQACAGDRRLQSAVEELLRHDADGGSPQESLISPVAQEAAKLRPDPPTLPDLELDSRVRETHPTAPGLHVPGYELVEELGRGGMGVVYKARQISLSRVVALKMLLPASPVDAQTLARFRTEAEALARLHHPSIVPIYDIGEVEERPFFSMEYVEGPSLGMVLEGRPQDPRACAALIETLARAVHAVHLCGIIHRDLKPANVLLSFERVRSTHPTSDSRVRGTHPIALNEAIPKITDFGLAKDQTTARQLTLTGTTMGTPSYMAPEQARGRGETVGPAADIYALGSILYEMLTGRPPFDAPTLAETVVALLSEEPVSPSRLQPRVPRDLATICLLCLEKSPRRRYASAIELAEDLQRFQAGEPIHARPVGPLERAYRWCPRRPLVAGLAALSSILAVAFVVTVLILYTQLRETAGQLQKKTQEQQRQIIHLHIEIGILDLEDGDILAALLRFTEALRQEEEDHLDEESDRTRIATILRQCPRLDRLVTLDRQVVCTRLGDSSGWVATVDGDNLVEVWEAPAGRRIGSPLHQEEAPHGGDFSADGQLLALISAGGTAKVWNLRTGKSNPLAAMDAGPVTRVHFHPECPVLTAQHADGTIRFWDCKADEPILMKELSGRDTAFAAISDDGRWCIRVTGDREVQEWDIRTAKPTGPPWRLAHGARSGAMSADGRRLAVVGPDETVEVWDSAAGKLLSASIKPHDGVSEVLLSPNGETVLTITAQGFAREWNMQTGRLLTEWPKMKCAPGGAHFSQSGRFVVMHDDDGVTEVADATTGRVVVPPLRHADNLALAAHSADGEQLITIGKHGLICTWTLPVVPRPEPADSLEKELLADREVKGPTNRITLKNGRIVQVEKWMTDAALHPPTAESRVVDQGAFSPDGSLVAIALEERTVEVFSVSTGERVARPLRHRYAVRHAAFSPDGRRLVAATAAGTARVWDVPTGETLAPPLLHAQAIRRVAFSTDGNRVLAFHEGNTATSWDVTPEQRNVQVLIRLAQVNACGRIDDKQEYGKINADRMRELFEALRGQE